MTPKQPGSTAAELSLDNEASDTAPLDEIQIILSEKRTSLSILRTGIAVFTLPLSVLSILVATSRYYEFREAAHFLLPLLILSVALVLLGIYLVVHAIGRIHRYDRLIANIKKKFNLVAEFLD